MVVMVWLMTMVMTSNTISSQVLFADVNFPSHKVDQRFSVGPSVLKTLDNDQLKNLLEFYATTHPDAQVLSRYADTHNFDAANFIHTRAKVHDHLILDGRKIVPSKSFKNSSSSIVQTKIDGTRYVGQVFSIITHKQTFVDKAETLLDISWFSPLIGMDTTLWDPL